MGSRTRYFLIGATLVVAVGLAAGLVAYYGGTWSRAGAGRAELAYVPAGARAVGYVNVRTIMDSPFRQRLQAALPAGEAREQFLAQTGIDVEKDIDSLVAGMTGGTADGSGVVILRGRFDQSRIETLITGHGATAEEYKSVRILHAPAEGVGVVAGVAFLSPTMLAVGTAGSLKAAIDAHANGASVSTDANLMRAVTEIESSGNAWLVGRTSGLASDAGLPDQVRQHLAGIEWLAVSASVNDTVHARVRAEALDDKAAEDLRAVVNGALGAARMFGGQDERIAAVLNSLQSTGRGRTVELSFTAPAAMLDLVASAPRGTPAPPAVTTPPAAPK